MKRYSQDGHEYKHLGEITAEGFIYSGDVDVSSSGTVTQSNLNTWSTPDRIGVIENGDSIEMIYKEISTVFYTVYPSPPPEERVFKIVFSCVDGKFNKSEPIYGEIEQATEETYIFE